MKTLENSNDKQDIILCQNSGGNSTLRLRRDLFLVNDITLPNFVLSIGSELNKDNLNDTVRFYNNGVIDFNNDIIINADCVING